MIPSKNQSNNDSIKFVSGLVLVKCILNDFSKTRVRNTNVCFYRNRLVNFLLLFSFIKLIRIQNIYKYGFAVHRLKRCAINTF